jgi:hypothetical protein
VVDVEQCGRMGLPPVRDRSGMVCHSGAPGRTQGQSAGVEWSARVGLPGVGGQSAGVEWSARVGLLGGGGCQSARVEWSVGLGLLGGGGGFRVLEWGGVPEWGSLWGRGYYICFQAMDPVHRIQIELSMNMKGGSLCSVMHRYVVRSSAVMHPNAAVTAECKGSTSASKLTQVHVCLREPWGSRVCECFQK